jgi:hypothetical protein
VTIARSFGADPRPRDSITRISKYRF